ncbi:amino acid synthesis family protein [Pseudonocardia sp. DSM 110487]|uniref:amino acid synthesis family protein n=1 Tax=Pseudonocardia sp. DSM 110487 TaxID=2865833 RepID=UPI001C69C603|nr:amino acid synthesis family protein [Pseudonocardia sp. DSM 110487]QYN38309.1 amino acid synthesis family protein [Pseudonocardia sp. DSM 110487]
MAVRKFVQFEEQVHAESGLPVSPPLTRVVVGAVAPNPLAGKPAPTDISPLVELSETLGEQLTTRALDRIGDPAGIRAYGKAALIGTAGDPEHGAASPMAVATFAPIVELLTQAGVVAPGSTTFDVRRR